LRTPARGVVGAMFFRFTLLPDCCCLLFINPASTYSALLFLISYIAYLPALGVTVPHPGFSWRFWFWNFHTGQVGSLHFHSRCILGHHLFICILHLTTLGGRWYGRHGVKAVRARL
jgi:hypothetical protein